MTTFDQKGKTRKIYRVEALEDGRWVEVCPRQPTVEDAAVKKHRFEKKGMTIRIVEQNP